MDDPRTLPTADELLRHAGWLRRLAGRLVGEGAADDLVQETWLSALRHRPQRGTGIGPWLRRVLHNRAANDVLARSRRRAREVSYARPEALLSTDDLVARAEATRLLVDAVLRLSTSQRNVILLRYFDEMAPAEIAGRLGMPDATVRSHLARGLERLRKDLDESAAGGRAGWTLALTSLVTIPKAITAASATAAPFSAVLLMTTTHKISVGLFLTLLGLGITWWQLGADRMPVDTETATAEAGPDALAAESPTTSLPEAPDNAPARAEVSAVDRRVVGRLLDARSREPLPRFALGLVVGPPVEREQRYKPPVVAERVVTDADGRFRSARDYPRGPMHAVLLEDWDRFASVIEVFGAKTPRPALAYRHEPGKAIELRVATGPAFHIDCPDALAIGADQFVAMLSDSEVPRGGIWVLTHVDPNPTMLARFPPLHTTTQRARPDKLHLLSKDGSWDGFATVNPNADLPEDPVHIDLFACGSLNLRISGSMSPQPREVRISLFAGALAPSELAKAEPLWELMTGGTVMAIGDRVKPGTRPLRFAVAYQRVGPYTAIVRSRGFDDLVTTIQVEQGKNDPHELTLVRSGAASGAITGHVHPRSGNQPKHEVVTWIQSTDGDAGSMRMSRVEWEKREGKWRGRFAFEGLLDDDYRVWVTAGPRVSRKLPRPETTPTTLHTRPGNPALAFDLLDNEPITTVEVRAADRRTGKSIDEFMVFTLSSRKRGQKPATAEDGRARLSLRGNATGTRFLVHAAGYVPAFVRMPAEPDSDGTRRAQATMAAGWGAAVRVQVTKDGKPRPIAGVAVLADGIEVARTDADGFAWPGLTTRPERMAVRLFGYTIEHANGPIEKDGRLKKLESTTKLEVFGFVLQRVP